MNKLKTVELFAGVGGFRIGLENTNKYEVVWSNQWEPNKKNQHASNVYENRFGIENHSNEDIETVSTEDIPNHDVLVGGFPCQAFSISGNQKGFEDARGTLFFEIVRIANHHKPKLLIAIVRGGAAAKARWGTRVFGCKSPVTKDGLNALIVIAEWCTAILPNKSRPVPKNYAGVTSRVFVPARCIKVMAKRFRLM